MFAAVKPSKITRPGATFALTHTCIWMCSRIPRPGVRMKFVINSGLMQKKRNYCRNGLFGERLKPWVNVCEKELVEVKYKT
jgi:hypothetical protein